MFSLILQLPLQLLFLLLNTMPVEMAVQGIMCILLLTQLIFGFIVLRDMAKHHKLRFHISQFYNGQHSKIEWIRNCGGDASGFFIPIMSVPTGVFSCIFWIDESGIIAKKIVRVSCFFFLCVDHVSKSGGIVRYATKRTSLRAS